MLKGHLDMIVLAALAAGPAHGYAVIEEIKRRSSGAFELPEGTIYPVLHRLEHAGSGETGDRGETAERQCDSRQDKMAQCIPQRVPAAGEKTVED